MKSDGPHYYGHRKCLRERFIKSGFDGFTCYEVVELLLPRAILRSNVKRPAKAIVHKLGHFRGILDANAEDLQSIDGLGSIAPVAFKVVREVAGLYLQQSAEEQVDFNEHDTLANSWSLRIGAPPQEVFYVAHLGSGYRLLRNGVEALEEGSIDRAAVTPSSRRGRSTPWCFSACVRSQSSQWRHPSE